jgi:phospholipid/cholesterol/gamma-HCH transport system permease protein
MSETETSVITMPRRLRNPDIAEAYRRVQNGLKKGAVSVDFQSVEEFDTSGLALLHHLQGCDPRITVLNVGQRLEVSLAAFLGGTAPAACEVPLLDFPTRVLHSFSDRFVGMLRRVQHFFSLFGDEVFYTFGYLRRKKGVYPGEVWNQLFFMGYKSFPITCVLIFLIGVTIALMSAQQLKLYGATIYVADLIGLAMLRELVPLMTAIILAGKVGAAVAAELSTMTVLEEVDALQTMGVSPVRFLMAPRLIAITLAVPLLVAVADLVGIGAGILVGRMSLNILPSAFVREMLRAVGFGDFIIGMIKTLVFGWVVVIGSGYKGLSVGRSAGEVGRATTESVVLSISLIVLIDCIFAFIIY